MRVLFGLLLATGGMLLGGCADRSVSTVPAPADDLADYGHIVEQSQKATGEAMQILVEIGTTGTNCPPLLVRAYGQEVEDLEVGSVRVRARASAILARGDAYFDSWQQHVSQVSAPARRKQLEEQRPALLEKFRQIKDLSAQTRDAFREFLAGMRKIRATLEQNPGAVGNETTRAFITSVHSDGEKVQKDLAAIRKQLAVFNDIANGLGPIVE